MAARALARPTALRTLDDLNALIHDLSENRWKPEPGDSFEQPYNCGYRLALHAMGARVARLLDLRPDDELADRRGWPGVDPRQIETAAPSSRTRRKRYGRSRAR